MKVKFATQTLSDALLHCAKDLNLPQFREAEATAEFCYVFNVLFDLNNSNNTFCKHSKAPLSNGNQIYWDHEFRKCEQYIMGLKHEDGKP